MCPTVKILSHTEGAAVIRRQGKEKGGSACENFPYSCVVGGLGRSSHLPPWQGIEDDSGGQLLAASDQQWRYWPETMEPMARQRGASRD